MKWKYAVMALFIIFLPFGCSTHADERVKNISLSDEIEQIKSMDISYVDPATIPDGEYTGEFPFRQRYLYRVQVTVQSGRIVDMQCWRTGLEMNMPKRGWE